MEDPAELVNVVDDLRYSGIRQDLEGELERLQSQYNDQPYRGPDTPRLDWSV